MNVIFKKKYIYRKLFLLLRYTKFKKNRFVIVKHTNRFTDRFHTKTLSRFSAGIFEMNYTFLLRYYNIEHRI